MVLINIITWAFEAYLVTLAGMWIYAVAWIVWSIIGGWDDNGL